MTCHMGFCDLHGHGRMIDQDTGKMAAWIDHRREQVHEHPNGIGRHPAFVSGVIVTVGSARYRDELRFRDYLRAHPDSRDEYAGLKRGLADRFRRDRDAYTESKTDFVRDILRRALASRSGPH